MWWKDSADTDVLALPLKCWPRHLLAELRTLAAPCTQTETVTRKYTTCLWREPTLRQTCASLTKWNTAGQSWALCLSSGGTVALHHTVVQQMARTGIGERSAFKLHGIHLMDETTWTQITERRKKKDFEWQNRYIVFIINEQKNWLVAQAVALPVSVWQQVPGRGRCGRDFVSFSRYRTFTTTERRCWRFLACG